MIDIDFSFTKRKGKGVRRYATKQQFKKAVEVELTNMLAPLKKAKKVDEMLDAQSLLDSKYKE